MTPFLARTLSWAEVANGTSIVFDLRITASTEKRRRKREVVSLRKRLRLSEHSFWNKASVSRQPDRQQYERSRANREQKIEPRQCAGPLDLQNKLRDGYPNSPLSLPFPRGVSSLTWTAGESRAVLFLGKQIAGKTESRFRRLSNIEQRADGRNGILSHYRSALRTCAAIESAALAPVRRKHHAPTSTAVVHRSGRGD